MSNAQRARRKARNLLAMAYEFYNRHEDARKMRAGVYDIPFVIPVSELYLEMDAKVKAAERSGQIAGTLFGVFVGFIVGVILLA